MTLFLIGFIFAILLMIAIFFYYTKMKRIKQVGSLKVVYNSWISLYLKMTKKHAVLFNPFSLRIHLKDKMTYINIDVDNSLYQHAFCHYLQIQKHGKLKFLILYIYYLIRYKYENNPFEKEAKEYENSNQTI